ncbi:unnamed protein product [Dibothriocephalus latus]|uniref:F-box domain-containing protein n=1 Tax=Dibothriocephalus latus TaxID=60516 RepID=A0A3P7N3W3_DIBLA|nr:unnamed protein product [Dibothriocephalus latus]
MGQLLSYTLTPDTSFPRPQQDSTLANLFSVIRRNVRKSIAGSSETPEAGTKSLDLAHLPPELAFDILSYLNATDLYLAACVWWNLASDEVLWQGLCRATWPFCSAYKTWTEQPNFSFRILFLRLDEARLTFNIDGIEVGNLWKKKTQFIYLDFQGIKYLQKYEILNDETDDLAMFLHSAPGLDPVQKRRFLETRQFFIHFFYLFSYYCYCLLAELWGIFHSLENFLRHFLRVVILGPLRRFYFNRTGVITDRAMGSIRPNWALEFTLDSRKQPHSGGRRTFARKTKETGKARAQRDECIK